MSSKRLVPSISRNTAKSEAEDELKERGCTLNADGLWEFIFNLDSYGKLPGKLSLPSEFPDELPEIFIERAKLFGAYRTSNEVERYVWRG